MIRAFNYATIFLVLSLVLVPWANAADLTAGYPHEKLMLSY